MALPFTFLLGLLVVFANRELLPPLAGSARLEILLPFALLLATPTVLAVLSLRGVRRSLVTGRPRRGLSFVGFANSTLYIRILLLMLKTARLRT